LVGAEERRGAAERSAGQAHNDWLTTLAGLDSRVAALGAAQATFVASVAELQAKLDRAIERGRADAEALQRLNADNGRIGAELQAVVAAKETAERLAQEVSARLQAAQSQAEAEIARFTAVEAEQRAAAEALRVELTRLTAAEAEQRTIVDTIRIELARRDGTIAELSAKSEAAHQRAMRSDAEAARLDGEVKAQNLKILDLAALRRVQAERLEEREAEIAALTAEAARLRQVLDDTEVGLAGAVRAREQLAAHAANLETSIREIRASTSWRVTDPLRRVSTALRRPAR
jgi:chromosome segregation ATPase